MDGVENLSFAMKNVTEGKTLKFIFHKLSPNAYWDTVSVTVLRVTVAVRFWNIMYHMYLYETIDLQRQKIKSNDKISLSTIISNQTNMKSHIIQDTFFIIQWKWTNLDPVEPEDIFTWWNTDFWQAENQPIYMATVALCCHKTTQNWQLPTGLPEATDASLTERPINIVVE